MADGTGIGWTIGIAIGLVCVALVSLMVTYYVRYGGNPFLANNSVMPNESSDTAVPEKTARLIMFYVNWCPHCRKAKPVWAQLKTKLDGHTINGTTLSVEMVNCEADKKQAAAFKVNAYPTFKLATKDKIFSYKGPARVDTLAQFAQDALEKSP